MSSAIQFRIACEECHERKIRCKQITDKEGVGNGSCQACQANSRKCLFSLKSKTGRPKISHSSSSTSSIPTFPALTPPSGPLSTSNPSSSTNSSPRTTTIVIDDRKARRGFKNPADGRTLINFNFNQNQTISEFLPEPPRTSPSMFTTDMSNNQFWQPNGEYEREINSLGSVFYMEQSFQPSSGSSNVAPMAMVKKSSPTGAIDPFINHFQDMPPGRSTRGQGNTTMSPQASNSMQRNRNRSPSGNSEIPQKIQHSQTDQSPEMSTEPGNSNSGNVSEFLRALELSHELRLHSQTIPVRSLSLLAMEDAEDVRILLASLDKLCTKISAVIPSAPHDPTQQDQSAYILVFAAVMEAIDQAIRRLGCLIELEPRFDPGFSKPDSMLCGGFDTDMNSLDVYSSTQDDSSFFPHNFDPESMSGGMIDTEVASMNIKLPDIEMEHLLSLTRLDYYLLRFKSFISHFDSSPDLWGATTFMFSPAGSMARLLSFHRCIEGIQSGWKTRWQQSIQ